MGNDTIFYTQIGSVLVFITALFVLYRVLVHQKDATIELLQEKNAWLQEQLENSKSNSSDVLAERLTKRISIFEAELKQLSEDYENNKALIEGKEESLLKTRAHLQELIKVIGQNEKKLDDLKDKIDVCPVCESELVELTYVEAEENSGNLRRYKCGYTEIDGYLMTFCPSDPAFPPICDFELITKYDEARKEWTCSMRGKTWLAKKVPVLVTFGGTEKEARQRTIDSYERTRHRVDINAKMNQLINS